MKLVVTEGPGRGGRDPPGVRPARTAESFCPRDRFGPSMDRRLALLVVAAVALSTVAPTASAHTCSEPNGDCGPCTEGERHEHNDQNGQCSSTASSLEGFTAPLLVGALAVALLVAGRIRG